MTKRGFLIMPFGKDLDWLRDEILAAGVDAGVEIERGDDVFAPGVILDQIFRSIDEADVVVGVCTGKNANVFFELGYAWLKHQPVLVAEDTKDLPFDISHLRVELYGREDSGGHRKTLRARLRKAIAAALEAEHLPRGKRLAVPPTPQQQARVTGRLLDRGKGHSLQLINSGTTELHAVDVHVPPEATSFHLMTRDLPVNNFRPGEHINLLASVVMGGGPSIFDILVTAKSAGGESFEFPIKVNI